MPLYIGRNLLPDSDSGQDIARCMEKGMSRMRNFQRQLVADGLKLKAYPFTKILDVDHASDIVKAENFLTGKDE